MKIFTTYKKLSVLILLCTLSISCELSSINQDPTRPGGDDVPSLAIVPVMQTQTHRNMTAVLSRYAGIFMQQWKGFDAQQVAFTSYVVGESDVSNPWDFGLYSGSLRDCDDIIKRTTGTGSNDLQTRGMAKVYLSANLGLTTSMWGDIPFTEAFKGADNLTPSYDSQQQIYTSIQRLLDEAISDLSEPSETGIQGDITNTSAPNWIKIAKSLKARYYLHQTSVNPNAAQLALDQLTDGIGNNSEQGAFVFENTQNGGHPSALFGFQRPNTMVVDDNFVSVMDGDPRQPMYMAPSGDGGFVYYQDGNANLFWAQLNSPSFLISYSETKFIEAEALVRTGANGSEALTEAIKANMSYLGISAADIDAYLVGVTLSGSSDDQINVIINEKYKALYGNSAVEIWNDYRRTGYPVLTPNVNGKNANNQSGIIPRRLLYPITERTTNADSYNAAIQNQGGHLLDDDMWIYPSN